MNANQSKLALERLFAEAGLTLDRLTVVRGFAIMVDFYRAQRAEDCPPKRDADMLLFQWGTYDSARKLFELDLTRQFMTEGAEDENIWQLSLTFKFSPTDKLSMLDSGNKWCPEPRPRAVDYFEGFVRSSEAYRAVDGLEPAKVELDYFNAG